MTCKICSRPLSEGVYCSKHAESYSNLEEGYQKWRYALGVSWIEYLEKIAKISGSGRWVREVINDILSSE